MSEFDCKIRQPDADSLCALLAAMGLNSLLDYCSQCDVNPILVGASSKDWCLKQIGGVFYRERCTNPSAVGSFGSLGYTSSTGSYALDGYDSIIRFAPAYSDGGSVTMTQVELKYISPPQVPASIGLRVGISGQVADSNIDNCPIKWNTLSDKPLKCLGGLTLDQYQKLGTVPSEAFHWNFLYSGRFVSMELKIKGTGGDCKLSGIVAEARSEAVKNY